jgi:hypothetical protein
MNFITYTFSDEAFEGKIYTVKFARIVALVFFKE